MTRILQVSRDTLSRLRRMSAPEIGHRLAEKLRVEVERATRAPAIDDTQRLLLGDLRRVLSNGTRPAAATPLGLRYLHERAARRFYPAAVPGRREELIDVLRARAPGWIDRSVEEAERLLEGAVPILGHGLVEIGNEVDWHHDPVAGMRWPLRFWADYDLVAADNVADPKVVHELNRHQHLPRLAKGYALTGDERFARCAVRQMLSWIEQNPRGVGINWSSSLEIGLRALSWLWTLFLLLPSEALSEATAQRLLASLHGQLEHVARYLSRYSSPNTHLLGEAAALFVGGTVLAGLRDARLWRERGLRILAQEAERQVLADGAHAELSSCYHCYSLDFYLQALALARHGNVAFPAAATRRTIRQAEFLLHLTRPDGTLPQLGDGDGGRALALARQDYRSFTDGLGTAALLFERADLGDAAGGTHEETLWLLGPGSWDRFDGLARPAGGGRGRRRRGGSSVPGGRGPQRRGGTSGPPACRPTSRGGYVVQRTSDDHAHLVFDCGDLGGIGGGHGHADALSIVLHSGGHEHLVDPGTGVYNLQPEWRDYFRSTRAHNTVVVDGADQSVPGGTFRWTQRAGARLEDGLSLAGLAYVEGEHDGYRRLPRPVTHRRRLLLIDSMLEPGSRPDVPAEPGEPAEPGARRAGSRVPPAYWLVFDDLRGEGRHRYDIHYHLSRDLDDLHLRPHERGGVGLRCGHDGSGIDLWVGGSGAIDWEILRGETSPPQGWVSRRYGEWRPAPVLRAGYSREVPAAFLSMIAPVRRDEDERWRVVPMEAAGEGAIAVRLEHGGTVDWVLLSPHGGRVDVPGCEAHGELFWLRTRDGSPTRLFARNADRLVFDGSAWLDGTFRTWFAWQGV